MSILYLQQYFIDNGGSNRDRDRSRGGGQERNLSLSTDYVRREKKRDRYRLYMTAKFYTSIFYLLHPLFSSIFHVMYSNGEYSRYDHPTYYCHILAFEEKTITGKRTITSLYEGFLTIRHKL